MENNELDDQLRELLGDQDPASASFFHEGESTLHPSDIDDAGSQSLADNKEFQHLGWKRIEASLNAEDQAFDDAIRQRINHLHPKYDPHTWPLLLKKFNERRFLRANLITVKSIEVLALLLFLLTAVNIGRMGKVPFQFEKGGNESILKNNANQRLTPVKPQAEIKAQPTRPSYNPDLTQASIQKQRTSANAVNSIAENKTHTSDNSSSANEKSLFAEATSGNEKVLFAAATSGINSNTIQPAATGFQPAPTEIQFNADYLRQIQSLPIEEMAIDYDAQGNTVPAFIYPADLEPVLPIPTGKARVEYTTNAKVPGGKFIKPLAHTFTEFAIIAQSDYNGLRMPEDRLYSSGKEIYFPSKGIMSQGFGGGFTIALGHPLWALETGVIYSAKNFMPGRQCLVGGAFDNVSVEFEAMKLQLVSIPIQYRYRFDHTGRFKCYALAGVGFNVIAQSDIDVLIKYHFPSFLLARIPTTILSSRKPFRKLVASASTFVTAHRSARKTLLLPMQVLDSNTRSPVTNPYSSSLPFNTRYLILNSAITMASTCAPFLSRLA